MIRDGAELPPMEAGYRLGFEAGRDAVLVLAATMGIAPEPGAIESIAFGAAQELPVRAADLMPGLEGAALGSALTRLEQDWIASAFKLTRDELIARA